MSQGKSSLEARQLNLAARATRWAFFAAGFATAAWAPLIPFLKRDLAASEGQLGLILLCVGIGSLTAMPLTGWISARIGARLMILLGGFGMSAVFALLFLAHTPVQLGALAFFFGASLGTMDVAMNIHGAEVENRLKRAMMSGFHAFFSIGGLVGAATLTALLAQKAPMAVAAWVAGGVILSATLAGMAHFMRTRPQSPPAFALPKGIVLLIAALSCIAFLAEGAIMDWGALLLLERQLLSIEYAGTGFILFSLTMSAGRLMGDWITDRFGPQKVLMISAVICVIGMLSMTLSTVLLLSLLGFALVGAGAANIVPVLFSYAGRQKIMSPSMALAAVTTLAYGGVLMGPASIGFIAQYSSLIVAFMVVSFLTCLIPVLAPRLKQIDAAA